MKRARRQKGKGCFDLIEEATHLLRAAPIATLAVYYLGAIPFVLGLLYFWADMSRSPIAGFHLIDFSLGLAALFVWMKFWQVIFARRLRAHAAAEPAPRWTARRCGRAFLTQAFVQPCALIAVPFSLLLLLPGAWVYAFCQNVTVLDDGGSAGTLALLRRAARQAALWPRQNLLVLAIVAGFGLSVFLNWAVTGLVMPHLIKMIFGIESVFTRSTFSLLNTTFFAAMAGLTYLCVDPILKAVYVLRCFYGESLNSGEDLRAELNSIMEASQSAAAVGLILVGLFWLSPVRAADPPAPVAPPATTSVSSYLPVGDLDRAIDRTIHEDKYTWRMPRQRIAEPDAKESVISRFMGKVSGLIRKWARAFADWFDEWLRKLSWHPQVRSGSAGLGYGWIETLQILLYGLVAAVLVALLVLLYRVWRGRRSPPVTASEPILPVPDVQDENVGADQLPEDGWTKLARELLERGELRLALRAYYLASLSHLAARNLIRIARFKSNRDYERELHRRGHSFPELLAVFSDNLVSFERIWYGLHEANRGLVDRFAANLERMKAAG